MSRANLLRTCTAIADIPLREGMQPLFEELDELEENHFQPGKEPEKWLDMGLQSIH